MAKVRHIKYNPNMHMYSTHPNEIPTPGKSSAWHNASTISQPDEILGIVKSSEWLKDQISYLIRMT